ncbi:MAG: hypothetical protein Q8K52_08290 [Thiobacillus sp.]|nr:hypothetical protein [Thiobacillus sp.]
MLWCQRFQLRAECGAQHNRQTERQTLARVAVGTGIERVGKLALCEPLGQTTPNDILAGAVSRQNLPDEQTQGVQRGIEPLAVGFPVRIEHCRKCWVVKHLVKQAAVAVQKLPP